MHIEGGSVGRHGSHYDSDPSWAENHRQPEYTEPPIWASDQQQPSFPPTYPQEHGGYPHRYPQDNSPQNGRYPQVGYPQGPAGRPQQSKPRKRRKKRGAAIG